MLISSLQYPPGAHRLGYLWQQAPSGLQYSSNTSDHLQSIVLNTYVREDRDEYYDYNFKYIIYTCILQYAVLKLHNNKIIFTMPLAIATSKKRKEKKYLHILNGTHLKHSLGMVSYSDAVVYILIYSYDGNKYQFNNLRLHSKHKVMHNI